MSKDRNAEMMKDILARRDSLKNLETAFKKSTENFEAGRRQIDEANQNLQNERFDEATVCTQKSLEYLEIAWQSVQFIDKENKLNEKAQKIGQDAIELSNNIRAAEKETQSLHKVSKIKRDAIAEFRERVEEAEAEGNLPLVIQYSQDALKISPRSTFFEKALTRAERESQESSPQTSKIARIVLLLAWSLLVFVLLLGLSGWYWAQSESTFVLPTRPLPTSTVDFEGNLIQTDDSKPTFTPLPSPATSLIATVVATPVPSSTPTPFVIPVEELASPTLCGEVREGGTYPHSEPDTSSRQYNFVPETYFVDIIGILPGETYEWIIITWPSTTGKAYIPSPLITVFAEAECAERTP